GCNRRPGGDGAGRSDARSESAPPERSRRGGYPSPHARHTTWGDLSSLLGYWTGRQARERLQSRARSAGKDEGVAIASYDRLSWTEKEEVVMRSVVAVIVSLPLALVCVAALATVVNFDNLPIGTAPPGWTATKTGTGDAKWTIEKDDTAPSKPNVLKQSGQATYPVCLKDDTNLKDGFVEVKLKPISGREDQAGGIVWRAKDSKNYYGAGANALEDNVTVYHTVSARRTEKKRVSMKVALNQWHTLRVEFQAAHFVVTFDGKKALDWDDETFKEAGKVGVWTKADSVKVFDDFISGKK